MIRNTPIHLERNSGISRELKFTAILLKKPEEQLIFVDPPSQQTEVFDQPEEHLRVPEFANPVKLTMAALFG